MCWKQGLFSVSIRSAARRNGIQGTRGYQKLARCGIRWSSEKSFVDSCRAIRYFSADPQFVQRVPGQVGAAARTLLNREKMSNKVTKDAIIWVDCEMTGLDLEKDLIMEIACIITGPNLDVVARQEPLIIKTPDTVLDSMGTWCMQHHGESGLTESCRQSTITMERAESILLDFVTLHTKPGTCPMGGNSIHMDRIFIQKYMPRFYNHFHYRNIDVSTVKELVRRWFPKDFSNAPAKRFEHRTLADVEDSIQELAYYRSSVFKNQTT